MPELPEVETTVRQLRPRLVGRSITSCRVLWPATIAAPGVASFRRGVRDRHIESLSRRGKYFVLSLEGGRHLVGHLRMSGRLWLGDGRAVPYARAAFRLDDGRELLFVDVRKFGRLALVDRPDQAMPPLGIEPLSDALDGAWMRTALRARRRLLKPLLLDQSFIAGLGNIYVDESLHLARLHPLRVSHRLRPAAADALAAAIRTVLTEALAAEGSSFDAFYRTPEGQPGRYQETFRVYGRAGRPCRRCGAPVVRIVVGQRGTHLCRRCQPAPRSRRVAT